MTLTEMLTDDECDATLGEFLSDDEYAYLVKSKEVVLNGLFALMMRRIMRLESNLGEDVRPGPQPSMEELLPGMNHLSDEEIGRRMAMDPIAAEKARYERIIIDLHTKLIQANDESMRLRRELNEATGDRDQLQRWLNNATGVS